MPAPTGDCAGALAELFEAHHGAVFGAAFRILGNAGDAEDVLQTVFLRLVKRPPTGQLSAAYLCRAAINASLDVIRSRKRSRLVALDQQMLEDIGPSVAPESDPERRFASLELRGRLREELSRVSPRAAEMFALRYFEGYRNSEIGPMLGTSRMTVAVTLHRLRKHLRAALAETPPPVAPERRVPARLRNAIGQRTAGRMKAGAAPGVGTGSGGGQASPAVAGRSDASRAGRNEGQAGTRGQADRADKGRLER